ncbi:AAA family ATPase [Paracoccus sp. KR1-242]|uniref:AAA family ATPase n=1 Tax=Paracoccus sp. KR1-242 TaxID=3410028 RepID=UPI003C0446FA
MTVINLDQGGRKSRFFSAASLEGKGIPDRHWLVRDLIPSATVTLLGGDGGTGKSLLALQLACSVAAGSHWLGRGVSGGSAVYVSAEDDEQELHRRLASIVTGYGIGFADLDSLTIRSLAGEDALLAVLDPRTGHQKASDLFQELDALLTDLQPAVVVLDTLADLFPGNENDRAQARQFIGILRGLAIRHDCAVVLLAHPSLSGLTSGSGTSGSTAWNNSVRSRLYLERVIQDGSEANPDARVLKGKKANYGRIGDEVAMTWRDGIFVANEAETGLDRVARQSKAERVFLKLLRTFEEQGRRVNASAGPNYAPTAFACSPEAEGVQKRALKSAMEALFAAGKIRNVATGPASRRVTYLELVP